VYTVKQQSMTDKLQPRLTQPGHPSVGVCRKLPSMLHYVLMPLNTYFTTTFGNVQIMSQQRVALVQLVSRLARYGGTAWGWVAMSATGIYQSSMYENHKPAVLSAMILLVEQMSSGW